MTNRSNVVDARQHLIIDADDTLWENNVYFERAIEEFIDFLDHSALSREDVRAVLNEIERANAKTHGYGSAVFTRNLRDCYQRLAQREIAEDDLTIVMRFGERILSHPMELIDGVEQTLTLLSTRHSLVLFTKGNPEEQQRKIDLSGIAQYFTREVIVSEKDVAAYLRLLGELACDPHSTWMIGNSPKSDINPALAAGLNAVFIPHEQTWSLEHDELASGPGQLLVLARFPELGEHF
ncbi:MAG TPA: HAD family hydrolase [Thermomicrobiales bacterium]|nr:HAD family hydrolase [Thermomicrobiales bacterium]